MILYDQIFLWSWHDIVSGKQSILIPRNVLPNNALTKKRAMILTVQCLHFKVSFFEHDDLTQSNVFSIWIGRLVCSTNAVINYGQGWARAQAAKKLFRVAKSSRSWIKIDKLPRSSASFDLNFYGGKWNWLERNRFKFQLSWDGSVLEMGEFSS